MALSPDAAASIAGWLSIVAIHPNIQSMAAAASHWSHLGGPLVAMCLLLVCMP